MGLDSYIYSIPKSIIPDLEYFDGDEDKVCPCYWNYAIEHVYLRKDWDFHEFMFDLYKQKGGTLTSNEFNGICVRLTLEDITLIEEKYKDTSRYDSIERGLASVKCLVQIEGLAVYYDSSW